MNINRSLQPDVSSKYILVTIRPGKHNFKDFGLIDLRGIDVNQADSLVKRGFPFFIRKPESKTIPIPDPPVVAMGNTDKPMKEVINPDESLVMPVMRSDKEAVNALLRREWRVLGQAEKAIFYDNEEYFLMKKSHMINIGDIQQLMVGEHATMKAYDADPKFNADREMSMQKLEAYRLQKLAAWEIIDAWKDPCPVAETDARKIAHQAIEKEKRIRANENYIWRYESILSAMPENTGDEKAKKKYRADEIVKRKQELIDAGKPYSRKLRSVEKQD